MRPRRRMGALPPETRNQLRGDACAGKLAYKSRSDAGAARDAMGKRGKQCRVYPCPTCGQYHLASNNKSNRANRGKH